MKKLETGTLVYSKKYGIGVTSFANNREGVYFQHVGYVESVPRSELFVKGDVVVIKQNKDSFGARVFDPLNNQVYLGYAPYTRLNHFVVTCTYRNRRKSGKGYNMVHDIQHYDKHLKDKQQTFTDLYGFKNCPITSGHFGLTKPNIQQITKYEQFKKDCEHLENEYQVLFGPERRKFQLNHGYGVDRRINKYDYCIGGDRRKKHHDYSIGCTADELADSMLRNIESMKRRIVLRDLQIDEHIIDQILLEEGLI